MSTFLRYPVRSLSMCALAAIGGSFAEYFTFFWLDHFHDFASHLLIWLIFAASIAFYSFVLVLMFFPAVIKKEVDDSGIGIKKSLTRVLKVIDGVGTEGATKVAGVGVNDHLNDMIDQLAGSFDLEMEKERGSAGISDNLKQTVVRHVLSQYRQSKQMNEANDVLKKIREIISPIIENSNTINAADTLICAYFKRYGIE